MARTTLFITMSLVITNAIALTVLFKMCKPFNWIKILIFVSVLILVIIAFYIGLYHPTTGVGKVLNSFLKLNWPIGTNQRLTELINNLTLTLMVLLINPVMGLMENLLGTIKKVKI